MKPVEFPQQHLVIAKDQPEYMPLPVHVAPGPTREVTSCWQMTWGERLKVLITGRVYPTQLTFGQALQPQRLSVDPPASDELDLSRVVAA